MSALTPHFAPIVVLLFLGSVFALGISLVVLFYGAVRRSAFFAKLGAGAAVTIAAGYFLLLGGVSLASSEQTNRGNARAGAAANLRARRIPGAAREDLV